MSPPAERKPVQHWPVRPLEEERPRPSFIGEAAKVLVTIGLALALSLAVTAILGHFVFGPPGGAPWRLP